MSPTRVRDSAQIPIAVLPTSESEALTAAYKQMLQAQQVEFSQKLEEIQAKCSQTLTTMNGEISAVRLVVPVANLALCKRRGAACG